MADDSGKGYALGRLVLDYIKAFMWPAVALVVVVIYQDDVRQILSERQVDIFGLRIGERVEQIESQTMAEIEDIRLLLETQRQATGEAAPNPQLSGDIQTKLSSLERNLSREISQVQAAQQAPAPAPAGVQQDLAAAAGESREARAAAAERRGFEALIDRDAEAALAAFEAAHIIWPDYHNVAELARTLRNRQDRLAAPESPAWTQIYRDILTQYSWGLPPDLRAAVRAEVAGAY
ncbi:hypothetical protein [Pelagibius sp. 7325]|uniref:hypothetical protein n=1 Tax=Pelagibius sp. 7325 TaxID=3131994 RepID=UPI0030ECFFE9